MLKALEVSFIVSLVSTLIIVGIPTVREQYLDKKSIIFGTVMFFAEMIYMVVEVFGLLNQPQTILTAIIWMWFPLIVSIVVAWWNKAKMEMWISVILLVISLIFKVSAIAIPVQQSLVYVHELSTKEETEWNAKNDREKTIVRYGATRKAKNENVKIEGYTVICKEETNNYADYLIYDKNFHLEVKTCYFDETFPAEKNTLTTLRRKYPTVILGEHKLDVDDNYNPYEVYAYREKLYASNGRDYGIIVFNLKDGTSEKYPEAEGETPSWVDFKSTYPR